MHITYINVFCCAAYDERVDRVRTSLARMRDLAAGVFLEQQRNVVLIGGTGTGNSHLAVSIARACIRRGKRGRFFIVVDLTPKPVPIDRDARQTCSAASTS